MSMVEMRQPSGFWSEDLVDVEEGDQTRTSCSANKISQHGLFVLLSLQGTPPVLGLQKKPEVAVIQQ